MRQQIRLRALLPLAVLGLLGAGFGAWAFGQGPEPASEPIPPTTTAAAPAPAAPGPVARKVWAEQANALCVAAITELEATKLPKQPTPREVENALRTAVKVSATFDKAFARLGWPRGEQRTVLALRVASVRETTLGRSALRAFRARDVDGFLRILDRIPSGDLWKAEMRRLGARACAKEVDFGAAARTAHTAKEQGTNARMSPEVALEWGLYFKRAVVLLFYTPASGLDGTSVLETRSAALDVGAAFLPVNVEANGQVSKLAGRYDVAEAPAILVFVRGASPRLAARFDRFVDRKTIAQAVHNAVR